jgi:hypothetical protein
VAPGCSAKVSSTVWITFDEVQVIVGTIDCASALVRRLVLMYTTCSEFGVCAALRRYAA